VYARGPARIVEAARTLEGVEPVEQYLAKLESSRRDASLARLADVALTLEEYSRLGTLRIPLQLNRLRGRLWEIKVGSARFPFYDLGDSRHMSKVVRLTHGFTKRQMATPRKEIDRGLWVISQDEAWVASGAEQSAIAGGEQSAIGGSELMSEGDPA